MPSSQLSFRSAAPLGPTSEDDRVASVEEAFLALDPSGLRFARVLRETFDQLLDGQRTGRWGYSQLRKTEKTHMGTLVEINLHKEFEFADGVEMDYSIAGLEVDCKFSRAPRGWQIPLEADGHVCLLVWADDEQSRWSAGLIRISNAVLRSGGNRDRKRTLNDNGLGNICWLWRDQILPENLLLHLDDVTRARIFALAGKRSGQKRVNELFRSVQGRIISRTAVMTAGQQDDPPKRVRDARKQLRPEGVVILGHQGDHPRIASALELPVPMKGEWVSVRLTPAGAETHPPVVSIAGRLFRRAAEEDSPIVAPPLDAGRAEEE
jgi:hypothetical protein